MAHVSLKSKTATIKLSPAHFQAIQKRAERCGVRTSAWMRWILLQAMKAPTTEGYMRIKEPDGTMT